MLADGSYGAVVVDVDDSTDDGTVRVELAVSAGAHKGDVVAVRGRFPGSHPLGLLGLPATIVVADGQPAVTLDR